MGEGEVWYPAPNPDIMIVVKKKKQLLYSVVGGASPWTFCTRVRIRLRGSFWRRDQRLPPILFSSRMDSIDLTQDIELCNSTWAGTGKMFSGSLPHTVQEPFRTAPLPLPSMPTRTGLVRN
jgi:hypothetical protein